MKTFHLHSTVVFIVKALPTPPPWNKLSQFVKIKEFLFFLLTKLAAKVDNGLYDVQLHI